MFNSNMLQGDKATYLSLNMYYWRAELSDIFYSINL